MHTVGSAKNLHSGSQKTSHDAIEQPICDFPAPAHLPEHVILEALALMRGVAEIYSYAAQGVAVIRQDVSARGAA